MFWSVWRHVANNVFGCVLRTMCLHTSCKRCVWIHYAKEVFGYTCKQWHHNHVVRHRNHVARHHNHVLECLETCCKQCVWLRATNARKDPFTYYVLRITYYVLRITYYVDATPTGDATHAGPMGHGPCRPRTDAQNSAPKLRTKVKNPL